MAREPTYKELEQKVKKLKKECLELKQALEGLRESEEKYRSLVKDSIDGIAIVQGPRLRFVNKAFLDMFGFQSEEELVDRQFTDFIAPEHRELMADRGLAREKGQPVVNRYEFKALRRDGTEFDAELSVSRIAYQGGIARQGIIRDISERKRAEEALQRAHNELERRVEERTAELAKANKELQAEIAERRKTEKALEMRTNSLEEVNTALKVLLKTRDEDKEELEEKVLINVKQLIVPLLERVKERRLDPEQRAYIRALESNLTDIISPFLRTLSSRYLSLTPTEIHVANLIKEGIANKEMARLMNLSVRTIEFHRENIRKKLGIRHRKTNLRSHLLSLQ